MTRTHKHPDAHLPTSAVLADGTAYTEATIRTAIMLGLAHFLPVLPVTFFTQLKPWASHAGSDPDSRVVGSDPVL